MTLTTLSGSDILVYLIGLAIAISIFFGTRWLLKKSIKTDNSLRNRLTWIGTIILTPIICLGLGFLVILYETYYPKRDFNEFTWSADREKRYEMTADLIESGILIGKTKDEVQKMLGKSLYNYREEDHWVYDVGLVPRIFNFDHDTLIIYFKDEKVERVEQYQK